MWFNYSKSPQKYYELLIIVIVIQCHIAMYIYTLHKIYIAYTESIYIQYEWLYVFCAYSYCIVGKFGSNNVWPMNRLTRRLLIVTTNLDGFSLVNR